MWLLCICSCHGSSAGCALHTFATALRGRHRAAPCSRYRCAYYIVHTLDACVGTCICSWLTIARRCFGWTVRKKQLHRLFECHQKHKYLARRNPAPRRYESPTSLRNSSKRTTASHAWRLSGHRRGSGIVESPYSPQTRSICMRTIHIACIDLSVVPCLQTSAAAAAGTTSMPFAGTTSVPFAGTTSVPFAGTTSVPFAETTSIPFAGAHNYIVRAGKVCVPSLIVEQPDRQMQGR